MKIIQSAIYYKHKGIKIIIVIIMLSDLICSVGTVKRKRVTLLIRINKRVLIIKIVYKFNKILKMNKLYSDLFVLPLHYILRNLHVKSFLEIPVIYT
jgi:hypothetical protein